LAHQRRHAGNPRAVRAIMLRPRVRAIHRTGGFEHVRNGRRQSGVAGFLLYTGKLIAILKIPKLILQQNQIVAEKQIPVGVICGVVIHGVVPGALLGGVQHGTRGEAHLIHGMRIFSGLMIHHGDFLLGFLI